MVQIITRLIALAALLVACSEPNESVPPPSPASVSATLPPDLKGRIVFSSLTLSADMPSTDVHVVTAGEWIVTDLTPGKESGFDPSWSPDGSHIAYRVEPPGSNGEGSDIWIMRSDGSGKTNLTKDGNGNWSPDWSPDGKRIAFAAGGTGNRQRIFVMNADGSNKTELNGEVEGEYPDWSPDGSKLAFMSQQQGASGSNANYDIFVMNADGTGLRQLTTARASDGEPSWSPDAKRIAFQSGRDDCAVSAASDCGRSGDIGPFIDVYVMNADGSEQRRLTSTAGYYPTWSADGQLILYAAGKLFVTSVEGGSAPAELPVRAGDEIDFSDWIE